MEAWKKIMEPSSLMELPEEIACEIVNRLEEFQDLFNYILTSKRFLGIARRHLKSLDSSTPIEVDIRLLRDFSALREVNDQIILITTPEVVSTLPNLRRANLFIEGPSADLVSRLNSRGHFRISDRKRGVYLHENRILTLPKNPLLEHVSVPLRLLDPSIREFLREGNFPHSIPSKEMAASGLIPLDDFTKILSIYTLFNRLYLRKLIRPDALMIRCFHLEPTLLSLPSLVSIAQKLLYPTTEERSYGFDLFIPPDVHYTL